MMASPKILKKRSHVVIIVVICITILLVNSAFTSRSLKILHDSVSDAGRTKPSDEQPQPLEPPVSTKPHEKQEQKQAQSDSHINVTPKHSNIPTASGTIPGIPGKVWQSAKDNALNSDQRAIIDSWLQKNPSFRHEFLTDDQAENFVVTKYNNTRPDIVALYRALPIAILRADLLRYLILLSEGGIWSDIDVTCETDVGHWLPAEMYTSALNISLIVGLEFDIPSTEECPIYSQLTNWVFAARAGSPHLQYVIDTIVKGLYSIAEQNKVEPSGITLDMISDVVEVTGPKIMTLGIAKSLSQMLGRTIDDRTIAGIKKPHLVGDVIVMPGAAFAAFQNGYPTDQGEALVSHHYAGSWKGPADAARERRKKKQEEKEKKEKRAKR
ncbi:hypothetical protein QQS21_004130 [Conoideocrella luteorostrata]|uniref:Uncharacterized protein n=1 Tax=Conoideocrella luteorostrata TaxID=1105319 RepID=A0AAJ0G010_9HYPO|nr:hypothetical protein QQS21_004130 [Conoideocrella luteorostrata]